MKKWGKGIEETGSLQSHQPSPWQRRSELKTDLGERTGQKAITYVDILSGGELTKLGMPLKMKERKADTSTHTSQAPKRSLVKKFRVGTNIASGLRLDHIPKL